ncbi:helix-turn-helix domain-containing protein [Neobacillus drentensis]|jgi:transcriptional regulator with XRE-family HTH domain|uniref:helix-turn-helix domain-containing protein n=1 Tax=Neobacillus drentensis TaxID=220684 RepID=UPI000824704C|nr:helix-turn-helix transcriptional regulator [Neobacillus drentensis]MDR7236784.1 transcriptional regulator with XRE-family HTH domain [Neobacillus drentensis]NHC41217.1 helix-turn-helix transcriptional regulator [Bacillus sp. MM2020_1]
MNNIGHQLKKMRLNREIEIEKLALLSGLNAGTIAAIEEGELDVQVSTLAKISDVLNCSFSIGDVSI